MGSALGSATKGTENLCWRGLWSLEQWLFLIAFYFLMVDIDDDFMQEENLVTEEMKSL